MTTKTQLSQQRRRRVRSRVIGTSERPRLCVRISLQHVSAQLIDDSKGHTLASVSTVGQAAVTGNLTAKATWVGEQIAAAAKQAKVKRVVFDRGAPPLPHPPKRAGHRRSPARIGVLMAITEQVKEFEERVIAIDRVSRVVKGGRRFRFRATVVIGDGRGRVGVGVGKGGEVVAAITKAVAIAKTQLITVPLTGTTIPHEIEVRYAGAQVLLKPASEGTGVIAGGAVRSVVEVAGIHDLLTKALGSTNKVNNAYATVLALSKLQAEGTILHQRAVAAKESA